MINQNDNNLPIACIVIPTYNEKENIEKQFLKY